MSLKSSVIYGMLAKLFTGIVSGRPLTLPNSIKKGADSKLR